MTANPNHYAKPTSVACPSCGFPHRVIDSGTWLRKCQNDLDRYGNGAHIEGEGTISSYEWQKQQHPDREPTACNAQFFVHSHVQIVARVSTVQWEDEKETTMLSLCCGAEEHEFAEGFCGACNEATGFEEGEG